MINVKFIPKKHTLSIEGHAGYAEKGKDIVCSAVSILLYTLAASLIEECMEVPIDIDINEGKSSVSCKPKKEYKHDVGIVYDTCLKGFVLLSESYPDYVTLEVL